MQGGMHSKDEEILTSPNQNSLDVSLSFQFVMSEGGDGGGDYARKAAWLELPRVVLSVS
jgi:hypothetical protein